MANQIGVVFHDVQKFASGTKALDARIHKAGNAAAVVAGEQLAKTAAALAPHGKTGNLSRSILVKERKVSGNETVQVGPTIIYGRRNDLGFKGVTKGGKQKRKGVLSTEIFGPSGKGVRVGWSTRGLQPTKPSHFMEKALAASQKKIAATFRQAWSRAALK